MRIGLDMDDTICSTEETIIKFANKYSIEQKINPDDIWYDEIIKRAFLTKYLETIYLSEPLKEDADKVINEIKNKGNEVIIITARSNSFININMELQGESTRCVARPGCQLKAQERFYLPC